MSIVEAIQELKIDYSNDEESFKKLQDALHIYHKLVDEGKLIPRGNTIEHNYTTCMFNSNFNK